MSAISHAAMILNWFENLLENEQPPRWMWALDEDLAQHFERVKADRDSGMDSDPGGDGPMMQNEYARDRGRNAR